MRFLGWLEDESVAPATRIETTVDVRTGPDRVGPCTAAQTSTGAVMDAVRGAARARLRHPGTLSTALGMELLDWNLARGAAPAMEPAWRALLRGEGVTVVAGQQPALLGGPLYTLYKLLSAIELAAELERSLGCPALAVFWVVGDDADFGEVSSAWLPGSDGSVRRVRDEELPPGGTMIGMLPAQRQLGMLPAHGPDLVTATVASAVASAGAAGGDWSGFLAALMFRLLPGVPCFFIDGAHPAVVREQSPWVREAARAWPLGELLREGEAEARAAGFEPALDPSLGDRAAFRLLGTRREAWNGEPGDAATLGPNVVLRPLLQDLLLPNAATVCGPSEVRYRAQLGPVYRHAGIPRPPLVPRLRAVLLPPGRPAEADGSPAEGIPSVEAFRDPDAYLAGRTQEAAPADLLARTDALRLRTRDDLAALGAQLETYDAGLPQIVASAGGKVDFQLQRVREGILARARQRLLRTDPRLAHWREFVRPRDGEQERSLSLLSPFLLDGPEAAGELREAARGHLRRWDEGRPAAAAVFGLPTETNEGRRE
jgi:bacillithiol synthase